MAAKHAQVTYTGDGVQTVFSFPFDYLKKTFVKVELNETTELTYGTDYSVVNKQVEFTTPPANGAKILIFRRTDTTKLVNFIDGSVLRAADMTTFEIQLLHIAEETDDRVVDDVLWYTERAELAADQSETGAATATTQANRAETEANRAQLEADRAEAAANLAPGLSIGEGDARYVQLTDARLTANGAIADGGNASTVGGKTPDGTAGNLLVLDSNADVPLSAIPDKVQKRSICFNMLYPSADQESARFIVLTDKYATEIRCVSKTAPTANTTIKVYKNGAEIASFTWASGQTTVTYDLSPDVTLTTGDILYAKISGAVNGMDIVTLIVAVVDR